MIIYIQNECFSYYYSRRRLLTLPRRLLTFKLGLAGDHFFPFGKSRYIFCWPSPPDLFGYNLQYSNSSTKHRSVFYDNWRMIIAWSLEQDVVSGS